MTSQEVIVSLVVIFQLAIAAAGVTTLIRFGNPLKRADKSVAWLIVTWAVTSILDSISWITLAFMTLLPSWMYILGFASAAVISWWRTLLIRPHKGPVKT
jgi:hypothetical protein